MLFKKVTFTSALHCGTEPAPTEEKHHPPLFWSRSLEQLIFNSLKAINSSGFVTDLGSFVCSKFGKGKKILGRFHKSTSVIRNHCVGQRSNWVPGVLKVIRSLVIKRRMMKREEMRSRSGYSNSGLNPNGPRITVLQYFWCPYMSRIAV